MCLCAAAAVWQVGVKSGIALGDRVHIDSVNGALGEEIFENVSWNAMNQSSRNATWSVHFERESARDCIADLADGNVTPTGD